MENQAKLPSLTQSAENSRTFFKKWKTLFDFIAFKLKLLIFSYVYGKNWALKCVPKLAVWFKNRLKHDKIKSWKSSFSIKNWKTSNPFSTSRKIINFYKKKNILEQRICILFITIMICVSTLSVHQYLQAIFLPLKNPGIQNPLWLLVHLLLWK